MGVETITRAGVALAVVGGLITVASFLGPAGRLVLAVLLTAALIQGLPVLLLKRRFDRRRQAEVLDVVDALGGRVTMWDAASPARPHVLELSLAGTATGDDELLMIAGLTRLRGLDLSDTLMTDAGLEPLTELKRLRTLHLSGTRVTDDGLSAISTMRELKRVVLKRTAVTQAAADDICEVCPNLRVEL